MCLSNVRLDPAPVCFRVHVNVRLVPRRFRVVSGAVAYFSRNAFETDLPIVVRSFCFLYVAYSPPMSAMSSVIVRAEETFASIASGAFELEHSASVVRALLESVSGAPGTWSR